MALSLEMTVRFFQQVVGDFNVRFGGDDRQNH